MTTSNPFPKVTVITVVYNAAAVIDRTMKSVQAQTWQSVEHLIIDGKSSDNTLAIIRSYDQKNIRIISEPDKGIYDAMNKGIANATGDFVIFMNGGDEFYDAYVLEKMLGTATGDFYFGNTMVVDEQGIELGDRRLHPPDVLTWRSLRFGMCVSHQSILVRQAICEPYDLKYKISGDIDWTIRVLKRAEKVVNTHMYVSRFLEGGVSSSRRKQGLKERFDILSAHYGVVTNYLNHFYILLRFVWHRISRKSMT